MDIQDAIENRRSVRAFTNDPVPAALVEQILKTARWAPSGVNTQPWQVMVLQKNAIQRVGDAITAALDAGKKPKPDYAYYPDEWTEPYKSRRFECGSALYKAAGIARDDMVARKIQWYKNYYFFGAPVGLIICIPKGLGTGAYLDTAFFIQNILLAARGLGLETCAQASLAEFPEILHEQTGLSNNLLVICGIAIGWADWHHPINQYRTTRADIESFTYWATE